MSPRLLYISLILSVVVCVNHAEQSQQLPLVKADYPVCVTVKPGTLEPKQGVQLYPGRKNVA